MEENKMKEYVKPELEIIDFAAEEITTDGGVVSGDDDGGV